MLISRRQLAMWLLASPPAGWALRMFRADRSRRGGATSLSRIAGEGPSSGRHDREEALPERVTLTSVAGLKVGHRTRDDRPTGCTVVLAEQGAVGGVAVRGAGPGTRDTELLGPEKTVKQVHAVMLSGGSAFGLAAADGAMRWLRDKGIGYPMRNYVVPIVPAAILYDLGIGDSDSAPDAHDGAAACDAASPDPPAEGSVGAGAGATVGKMFGIEHAMKGGVGTAGFRFDDGTVVAALVAVNCRGDVRDPKTGRVIAGARADDGRSFRDAQAAILAEASTDDTAGNTTLGVVATNRTMSQPDCAHLANVAHDGLARAVVPAHTRMDGDTIFFLATGAAGSVTETADHDRIEVAAAAAVTEAILRAVRQATGLPGFLSVEELGTG